MEKPLRTAPVLRRGLPLLLLAAFGLAPALASAELETLGEEEMSAVNGQDGIILNWTTTQMSAAGLRMDDDNTAMPANYASACTGGADCGGAFASGVVLTPNGGPVTLTGYQSLDVGSSAQASTFANNLAFITHLNQFRLGGAGTAGFKSGIVGDLAATDFGEWAMLGTLDFRVTGQPFYGTAATSYAQVYLALTNGKIFYRQSAPTAGVSHSNITLNNLSFIWDTTADPLHSIDIEQEGLHLYTGGANNYATFTVGFDLLYKFNNDQDMTTVTANDRPLLSFSWGGNLYDATLFLRSGGRWDTSTNQNTNVAFNAGGTATTNLPSAPTQGFSVGMRWNYRDASNNNNFLWSIGHASGDREYVEFGDWKNIEAATGPVANRYGFDFPLLAFDTVAAGSATNAGGSLCWGNTMTNAACSAPVDRDSDGLYNHVFVDSQGSLVTLRAGSVDAIYNSPIAGTGRPTIMQLIRNGNILSMSNRVRIFSDAVTFDDFAWGLNFTMANINSNLYMYTGGNESDATNGTRSHGAVFDILFTTQSDGALWQSNFVTAGCNPTTGAGCTNTARWSNGSHFMISDSTAPGGTGTGMGIGIIGSSVLIAFDDTRIYLKDTPSGQTWPNNWDGGIDVFSPRARFNWRGLFGGARLPRGIDLVRGANIDTNLEGLYDLRISPPPSNVLSGKSAESNDFLAFSLAARLKCGSATGTIFNFGCTINGVSNVFTDAPGNTTASGLGTYISIEEPGAAGVALQIGDMSGDLAVTQGTVQLRSKTDVDADTAPNTPTKVAGKPELVIAGKLLVGASAATRLSDGVTGIVGGTANMAGGPPGRTVTFNGAFGGNYMWSTAIPAGSFYQSFTLLPQ